MDFVQDEFLLQHIFKTTTANFDPQHSEHINAVPQWTVL
jgi:hypothetical protein